MGSATRSFFQGGCGCVAGFVILGVIVASTGGRAHADMGGLLVLFLIGGVVGLVIYSLRGSGRSAAPHARPRPSGPWSCRSCGAVNKEDLRGCFSCGEARP